MARGNTYTCRSCGVQYDYCPSCVISPVDYMEDNYCSAECKEIFDILSANGCKLATAKETAAKLKNVNIKKTLRPEIQEHIANVMAEAKENAAETSEKAAFFKKK